VTGYCEQGNEHLGYIKGEEICEQVIDYQLLTTDVVTTGRT
jgi:hypothetical protein